MRVGFVHGVMNTDNMSILGLTIDYGPYGWIEPFALGWTPNITDASGRRYRFGAQPQVAHWNLAQLARALAPLVDDLDPLRAALDRYPPLVSEHYRATMLRKLGLSGRADLAALDDDLLTVLGNLLQEIETDMTIFFRQLAKATGSIDHAASMLEPAYYTAPTALQRGVIGDWLRGYLHRVALEGIDDAERRARMDAINPLYVPRNYVVQQVIEATEAGDRKALPELLDVLRHPYTEQAGRERFAEKRPAWAAHKPGCSMLSCSS
jgi:uncharacterized protein YdiU (UPF0061 family)